MIATIERTENTFLKEYYIGKNIFHIVLNTSGYEEEVDRLAESASQFSCVLIDGDEPLKTNKIVAELCKNISKLNPNCHIIIKTCGNIRPLYMNSLLNVEYIIIKESFVDTSIKIEDGVWVWFSKNNSKFVFTINNDDDLENIDLVVAGLAIPKYKIWININTTDYKITASKVLYKGYNYNVCVGEDLVDKERI